MKTAATGSGAGASPPGRRRRVPALDGLRGLAVVAVIAYHLNSSWLPGGYLGVDIFFVISGFLITGLLLDMFVPGARAWPQLRDFWARRARRLLPALVALVVVVGIAASLTAPDAVPRLREDIPAALAFVANWSLLLRHESYFQSMGRPPLLQHVWSLGVEEQFYLAWPWVVLLVARRARRPEHVLCWVAGVGALASAGLMAVLFVPGHDASNVYYDTFTHASGLMIGSGAAALVRAHGALFGRWKASSRAWAGVVALAGLALLGAFASDSATFTYRGGILLASALTGLVVLVGLRPGPVTRALSLRPLHYLGTRSYSLYLWHWPIICLTRPDVDIAMSGVQLLALRLALIVGASEISYRYVEQPFRTGRAQQALRALRPTGRRWVLSGAGVSAVAVITLLAASNPPPLPSSLAVGSTPAARAVLPGPLGGYTSSGSNASPRRSHPGTQPGTTSTGTTGMGNTGTGGRATGSTGPGAPGIGSTVPGSTGPGSTGPGTRSSSTRTATAGKAGPDGTVLSTGGGTTATAALTSGASSGLATSGPGAPGQGSSSSGAPGPSVTSHQTGASTPATGVALGRTQPATPDGTNVQTSSAGHSTSTSTSAAQTGASSSTTVGLAGPPGKDRTVDRGSGPASAVRTTSPASAQTTTTSPGTTTVTGPEATGTVLAGSTTTSSATSSTTAPAGTSVPRTSGQTTSTPAVLASAPATTTTAAAGSTTTTTKPPTAGTKPTTTEPTATQPTTTEPTTTSPGAAAQNAQTSTSSSVYLRKHYVLAIGDSVLVAASQALEQRLDNRVTVDAAVGRQVWQGINRLRQYQRVGDLKGLRAVVIDLGTNGPMTPADVAQFRHICQGVPLLVFVNVRVPLPWQSETNGSLAAVAHQPGVRVVNWYGASAAPGVLWPDAVHPDPKGQALYAKLVAQALGM